MNTALDLHSVLTHPASLESPSGHVLRRFSRYGDLRLFYVGSNPDRLGADHTTAEYADAVNRAIAAAFDPAGAGADPASGLAVLGEAISEYPLAAALYSGAAQLFEARGQLEDAIREDRQAVALDPSPNLIQELARHLGLAGRHEESLALFEHLWAIRHEADRRTFADALQNHLHLLLVTDRWARMNKVAGTVWRPDRSHVAAGFHVVLALYQLGRMDEAREELDVLEPLVRPDDVLFEQTARLRQELGRPAPQPASGTPLPNTDPLPSPDPAVSAAPPGPVVPGGSEPRPEPGPGPEPEPANEAGLTNEAAAGGPFTTPEAGPHRQESPSSTGLTLPAPTGPPPWGPPPGDLSYSVPDETEPGADEPGADEPDASEPAGQLDSPDGVSAEEPVGVATVSGSALYAVVAHPRRPASYSLPRSSPWGELEIDYPGQEPPPRTAPTDADRVEIDRALDASRAALAGETDIPTARYLLEKTILDYPQVAQLHVNLALLQQRVGQLEEACHAHRQAVACEPIEDRLEMLGHALAVAEHDDQAKVVFDYLWPRRELLSPEARRTFLQNYLTLMRNRQDWEQLAYVARQAWDEEPGNVDLGVNTMFAHREAGNVDAAQHARERLRRIMPADHPLGVQVHGGL